MSPNPTISLKNRAAYAILTEKGLKKVGMDDMKRLFSTPKKTIISGICIAAVVIAAGVIICKSTLITGTEAKAVALKDAGLNEAEALALRARLEFDDGRFQYEVDFYNNGTEYEYSIQAKNGEIISRDIDGSGNRNPNRQDMGNQSAADENSAVQPREDQIQANPTDSAINNSNNDYIGVDRAKEIALNHAGLNESDVQFVKAKQDNDDGRVEYEIEFYFGRTEYDYTIDAVSGDIIEYDMDKDI